MRPPGEIQRALSAAWQAGPAPVRVAAERACVGMAVAKYTATRMVQRGDLVVVTSGRPAVLGLAPSSSAAACDERHHTLPDSFFHWPDLDVGMT